MFSSSDDAYTKSGNSVLSYKDKPVIVVGTGLLGSDGYTFKHKDVAGNSITTETIWNDKDLDFRYLGDRLGYMNQEIGDEVCTTYVARMPIRKTIIGLRYDNIHMTPIPSADSLGGKKNLRFDLYLNKHFLKMWYDKYPKLEEVKESFEDRKTQSVAFNRKFAINRKSIGPFFLEYRGKDIGWSEDIDKFTLDRRFRYLTETLEYYGVDFK